MSTYTFNDNKKVILYGAASTGILFKRILEKHQITVVAYVDKRADEIKIFDGIPVYSPLDMKLIMEEETVIIIAIKNVFEHEKIANQFIKAGFSKVIYRPYDAVMSYDLGRKIELNLIYDAIQNDNFTLDMDIPYAKLNKRELRDLALIKKEKEYCIVYLPMELIFTDRLRLQGKWNDISIFFLFPHIELFATFAGRMENSIEAYKEFCVEAAHKIGEVKTTKAWFESVVKQRIDVYNNMEYNYELNSTFFVSNAPRVIYDKGHFNLKSGKHRAVFLMIQEKRYMPVKMLEEDYIKWKENSKIEKLYGHIMQEFDVKIPIFHPLFYQIQNEHTLFFSKCIKEILYYLGKYLYINFNRFETTKLCIMDMSGTWGFFSRCLHRMRFTVSRYKDEIDDLTRMIDEIEMEDGDEIPVALNSELYDVLIFNIDKYSELNIDNIDLNIKSIFVIVPQKKMNIIQLPNNKELKVIHSGWINGETFFLLYISEKR